MCWILVLLWPFFSLSLGHLSPNYLSLQGQHSIPKYSTLSLACHGFPYLGDDGECPPPPPAKNLFILPNLEKFPAVGSPPHQTFIPPTKSHAEKLTEMEQD